MMTATQPSSSRNDEFRLQLGLFVLAALPLDEHLEVEQHLTECADCRAECHELSDVPAMFSSLSAEDMRALADEFAPASRRERRGWLSGLSVGRLVAGTFAPTRWALGARIVAAAAAVAVMLSVGIGVWLQWPGGGAGSDLTVAAKNQSSGARASIVVTGRDTGAHVEATLSGLEPGVRYELVAVAVDGETAVAAQWAGTSETSKVVGDVGLAPDDLAFFTVAEQDGSVVLTVRVLAGPTPS